MDAERLLEISAYWSFWDRNVPAFVARDVVMPRHLRDSLALVIQGVRRCGKSTLLTQVMDLYRLDSRHCAFLNFEDPRLGQPLDHSLLDAWVAAFRRAHPRLGKAYFFLDEIQGVNGWEKWLRTQLERPAGNHFVITGSDARLLSGEMSGVLTGRHLTVELFPFDLAGFGSCARAAVSTTTCTRAASRSLSLSRMATGFGSTTSPTSSSGTFASAWAHARPSRSDRSCGWPSRRRDRS